MSRKRDILLSIAFAGAALSFPFAARAAVDRDERPGGPEARNVEIRVRETLPGAALRAGVRVHVDPLVAAADALDENRDAYGRGPQDGFAFRLEEKDALGQSHVRMSQTYRGIRVLGGELIVHVDDDGLLGINGRFVSGLDLPAVASLAPIESAGAAVKWIERDGGANIEVVDVLEPVIWALDGEPALTVPIRVLWVENDELRFEDVYVDASSGAVVGSLTRMYTAKTRKVYTLNQACISTGNEMPGTLLFQEGGSSSDTAAMGAYNGTGTTYDYYKAIFNRDSYDNAGAAIVSSVHGQFSTGVSCTKNNAAWFDSPYNEMVYGDGDGSTFSNLANGLDVTSHEMTHAVCSRTADLVYEKESGALNEANSDILGRSAAFWGGNGNAATTSSWTIGADVYTPGTSGDALRYMYDPAKDGQSADYYPTRNYPGTCTPSSSNDECGVHTNSGIANLFYFLLSQGGTHPRGKTTVAVTGVGLTKSQQIWYRALSVYMTSATTFQGARTATANAASDLYGGTCTAEWQAVHKAWDAVGVPGTWSCGTTYTIAGNAGTSGATVAAGTVSTTSDTSGNYTLAGLAAGTYSVAASKTGCTFSPTSLSVTVGPSATGQNFTASCPSGDTALTSGVTLAGQSVAASAWKYYYIDVPSGASSLTFATTGATGDVDIYTQFNAKPTSSSYACRPYTSSGNETCTATNPSAGRWWLGVYGYAAGSYSVTATVQTTAVTYSIAGSAGTAGATVTAGTKSATSDASNNYSITSLAAGTYTVTPSKSGCTFSPTSLSVTVGPNATGKNFTATCGGGGQVERLTNGGFETLTASTNSAPDGSWSRTAYSGTSFNTLIANGSAPHAGTDYAYAGVYSSSSQTVTSANAVIPSAATSATLTFYVSIVTSETTTSTAYDKLSVQLVDGSTGSVLATLGTLSNLNKTASASTYALKSYSVTTYKGKTVKVRFAATNDSSLVTSFRIDDVSLKSDG
jgi:vibriolysin